MLISITNKWKEHNEFPNLYTHKANFYLYSERLLLNEISLADMFFTKQTRGTALIERNLRQGNRVTDTTELFLE